MVFSHLSTLIALIFGLTLTNLFDKVVGIIENYNQIRIYSLSIVWSILLFIGIVQWWWGFFSYSKLEEFNFFFFLFTLLTPLTYYFASNFIIPRVKGSGIVELKTYYYNNAKYFFTFAAIIYLQDALRGIVVTNNILTINSVTNLISAVLVLMLAISKSEKFHVAMTIFLSTLFFVYVVFASLKIYEIIPTGRLFQSIHLQFLSR